MTVHDENGNNSDIIFRMVRHKTMLEPNESQLRICRFGRAELNGGFGVLWALAQKMEMAGSEAPKCSGCYPKTSYFQHMLTAIAHCCALC